jgi:HAD superfamily hydrolase (TIGR01509 family)
MANFEPQISLVIFDCDGVLVDSELLSASTLIDVFSEIGIGLDLPFVYANFVGHSFTTVAAKFARQHGTKVPDTFEQDYRSRLLKNFEGQLQAVSGIEGVLDNLSVPFCLASGSSPTRVNRSLEIAGLEHRFKNRIFTTNMVANGKPAPDIYLHAAATMNVRPENCLAIEDSTTGIAAATAAGMRTWQFKGGVHFKRGYQHVAQPHLVDREFNRMSDFFETVPQLRQQVRV